MSGQPTVLIVPGLRDAVPVHWQTLLEAELREAGRPVASVPPMGRVELDRAARVAALHAAVSALDAPVLLVAHSGGCITVAHWAHGLAPAVAARVTGALLAAPPDFERPMPDGYPSGAELAAAGWLPVPRARLPFPGIVASSRNDPLGAPDRVAALARDWGAPVVDAGAVGHLNPASGYGPWPEAHRLIDRLRPCAAVAPEH